jgi:hypothetical protein
MYAVAIWKRRAVQMTETIHQFLGIGKVEREIAFMV